MKCPGRNGWILLLSLVASSCVGQSIAVEGFYDQRVPAEIEMQPREGPRNVIHDTELDRAGIQGAFAHPYGFYRVWLQFHFEKVAAAMPEGPADFSGVGAGFGVSGRRIMGLVDEDSTLLTPYLFEFNVTDAFGSSRPEPDLEYDRFFYREALFHLGLGAELSPLILTGGWAVQFISGDTAARDTSGVVPADRRSTFDDLNHGPFVTVGLLLPDERPVRVELRLGGGDLEEIRLGIGLGF